LDSCHQESYIAVAFLAIFARPLLAGICAFIFTYIFPTKQRKLIKMEVKKGLKLRLHYQQNL
jgi:hypothetical protein